MSHDETRTTLLWISKRYAINMANVSTVFRGTHGEIQITFIGGPPLHCSEKDLTPAAATLLLPHPVDDEALHLEYS